MVSKVMDPQMWDMPEEYQEQERRRVLAEAAKALPQWMLTYDGEQPAAIHVPKTIRNG